MMHLQMVAATAQYWQPVEQTERERRSQQAALAVAARRGGAPASPESPKRRTLIPRIAGALGLF